jgi:hypothetical protein
MRFFLAILTSVIFYASFLQSTEPSFKFTLGSNLGNIPLEINKTGNNLKPIGAIKINSWILSPNYSFFAGNKILNLEEKKRKKESLYIKFNYKF